MGFFKNIVITPKIRKIIFISLGALAALICLILILYFSLKRNSQDLIFARSFNVYEKHTYIKKVSTCLESRNTKTNKNECNWVDANMTFYISNITKANRIFNQTESLYWDFNVVETLLYFTNLTYSNSTNSFMFRGSTFNSMSDPTSQTNDTDYENNGPIIKAQFFENGTIYRVYKPVNISQMAWDYILQAIKEFSPDLPSFLYQDKHNGIQNMNFKKSLLENVKSQVDRDLEKTYSYSPYRNNKIAINGISDKKDTDDKSSLIESLKKMTYDLFKSLTKSLSKNSDSDYSYSTNTTDFYYEKTSLTGNGFAVPRYDENKISKSQYLKRTIDKDSYLDISFPNNSHHQIEENSKFNLSTGKLDEISKFSYSEFNSVSRDRRINSQDDFFDQDKRKSSYETDFSEENVLSGDDMGYMRLNTTTKMVLVDFDPYDKETTELLQKISSVRDYETLEILEESRSLNLTKVQEEKAWQAKVDYYLNQPHSKERLLLPIDSIENSLEEAKEKTFDIIYPIFRGGLFGWESSLTAAITLDASRNKMSSKITFNLGGLGYIELLTKEFDVNISGAIDGLIDFLKKAAHTIDELIDLLKLDIKFDFLKKLGDLFSKISLKVEFPLDIKSIYNFNINEKISVIIDDVLKFANKLLEWFKEKKIIFKNPLLNLTSVFNEFSLKSGLNYLDDYYNILVNETETYRKTIAGINEIITSPDVVEIFPDLQEDVEFIGDLIKMTYQKFRDRISQQIKEDSKKFIDYLKVKTKSVLDSNFNNVVNQLLNSQFAVAINDTFTHFKQTVGETFNSMNQWVLDSNSHISELIYGVNYWKQKLDIIEIQAQSLVTNVSNDLKSLKSIIDDKIAKFDALKIYEKLSSQFTGISNKIYEFRFEKFFSKFSIPILSDFSEKVLNEYYQIFYLNLNKIESLLTPQISNIKADIESGVDIILQNIKYNNKLVKDIANINFDFSEAFKGDIDQLKSLKKINRGFNQGVLKDFLNFLNIRLDDKLNTSLNSSLKSLAKVMTQISKDFVVIDKSYHDMIRMDLLAKMDNLFNKFNQNFYSQMKVNLEPVIKLKNIDFVQSILKPKVQKFDQFITEEQLFSYLHLNPENFLSAEVVIDMLNKSFDRKVENLNQEFIKYFKDFFDYDNLKASVSEEINQIFNSTTVTTMKSEFKDNTYLFTYSNEDPQSPCLKTWGFHLGNVGNDTVVNKTLDCLIPSGLTKPLLDSIQCSETKITEGKCLLFKTDEVSEVFTVSLEINTFIDKFSQPDTINLYTNYFIDKLSLLISNKVSNYIDHIDSLSLRLPEIKSRIENSKNLLKYDLGVMSSLIQDVEKAFNSKFFNSYMEDFQHNLTNSINQQISSLVDHYSASFHEIDNFFSKLVSDQSVEFIPDFLRGNLLEIQNKFTQDIKNNESKLNYFSDFFSKELYTKFSFNLDIIIQNINNNLASSLNDFKNSTLFLLPKNMHSTFDQVLNDLSLNIQEILKNRQQRKDFYLQNIQFDTLIDYNKFNTQLQQLSNNLSGTMSRIMNKIEDKSKSIKNFFEFNSYEKGKEIKSITDYITGFNLQHDLLKKDKQMKNLKMAIKTIKMNNNLYNAEIEGRFLKQEKEEQKFIEDKYYYAEQLRELHENLKSENENPAQFYLDNLDDYFTKIDNINLYVRSQNRKFSDQRLTNYDNLRNQSDYALFFNIKGLVNSTFSQKLSQIKNYFSKEKDYLNKIDEYSSYLINHVNQDFELKYQNLTNYVFALIQNLSSQSEELLKINNFSVLGENIINFENFYKNIFKGVSKYFTDLNANALFYINSNVKKLKDKILSSYLQIAQETLTNFTSLIREPCILSNQSLLGLDHDKTSFISDSIKFVKDEVSSSLNSLDAQINSKVKLFVEENFNQKYSSLASQLSLFNLNTTEKLYTYNSSYSSIVLNRNNSDQTEFQDKSLIFYKDYLNLLLNCSSNITSALQDFSASIQIYGIFAEDYLNNGEKFFTTAVYSLKLILSDVNESFELLSDKVKANYLSLKDTMNDFKVTSVISNLFNSFTNIQNTFINNDEFRNYLASKIDKNFDSIFKLVNDKMNYAINYVDSMRQSADYASTHIFVMMEVLSYNKLPQLTTAVRDFFDKFTKSTNFLFNDKILTRLQNDLIFDINSFVKSSLDPSNMFSEKIQNTINTISNIQNPFLQIFDKFANFLDTKISQPIKNKIESIFIQQIVPSINTSWQNVISSLKNAVKDLNDKIGKIYYPVYDTMVKLVEYEIKIFKFIDKILDTLDVITNIFTQMVDDFLAYIDSVIDEINKLIDDNIEKFERRVIDDFIKPIIGEKVLGPVREIGKELQDDLNALVDMFFDKISSFLEKINNNEQFNFEKKVRAESKYKDLVEESDNENSLQLRNLGSSNSGLNLASVLNKINIFNMNMESISNIWKNIEGVQKIFEIFNTFKSIYANGVQEIISRVALDLEKINKSVDKLKLSYIIDRFVSKVNIADKFSRMQFVLIDSLMTEVRNTLQYFTFNAVIEHLKSRFEIIKNQFMSQIVSLIGSYQIQGDPFERNFNKFIFMMLGPVPLTMNFGIGFGFNWYFKFGTSGLDIYAGLGARVNSYVQASAGVGLPLLNFSAYIRGIFAEGSLDANVNLPMTNVKFGFSICFNARFGVIEAGVYFEMRIDIDVWFVHIHFGWRVNMYGPVTLYGGYQMNNICPVKVFLG